MTITAFFLRIYTQSLEISFGDAIKAIIMCLLEGVTFRFLLTFIRITAFIGYRKNPAVGTMNDSNKQLNAIGIQLGLTPKGRQELMEIASQKKEKSMAEQMKEMGLA